MKNKAYLLPACKTADGVPIGIGSEVYAITFKQKVNKYGRLYRPSTRDLAVVKVTVSTVTFSEFVEPGWFGWTGVAYSGMTEVECSDGKTKTFSYLPGIEVSQYTIFASEDAAKAALEKAVAGGGLYTRAGFPLMPSWQIGEVRATLEKAEQSTEEIADMQKTCLNCTHVGVCSKRMQFIVNNYLVKRHYNEIENVSKTLDISVNCDSYAEKDFFSFICARVRDYSDGEVWSDGDQILCKTESAANALCDLLWQLYNERGEAFDLHTGYYDHKEDERNHEEDRYTGWWYVSAD